MCVDDGCVASGSGYPWCGVYRIILHGDLRQINDIFGASFEPKDWSKWWRCGGQLSSMLSKALGKCGPIVHTWVANVWCPSHMISRVAV